MNAINVVLKSIDWLVFAIALFSTAFGFFAGSLVQLALMRREYDRRDGDNGQHNDIPADERREFLTNCERDAVKGLMGNSDPAEESEKRRAQ